MALENFQPEMSLEQSMVNKVKTPSVVCFCNKNTVPI